MNAARLERATTVATFIFALSGVIALPFVAWFSR